jgi:protein-S-isoprenylcysteine O-methyltransferase Ste14
VTTRLLLFAVLTALLAWVSRGPLGLPRSHGFPRFFAWECMLALLLLNFVGFRRWFADPLSVPQLVSWVLLFGSLVPALVGGYQLLLHGRPSAHRPADPSLFDFEKTTQLVTTGVYRYVRHPLYGSLLLLTWGIFWKRPSWPAAALALVASVLLTATAKREEGENLAYFGDQYRAYQKVSRMFVPFVF